MDTEWPDLWWDSRAIRGLRRKVQKSFATEELWAWLVQRRLSIYVSLLLARARGLRPNHVTAVAALITAATALWTAAGGGPGFVWLAVIYNFVYLLDCVDGELARLTSTGDRTGEWLDGLLGLGLSSLPCALGISLLSPVAGRWLGVAAVVLFMNVLAGVWLTVGARAALGVDVSAISVPFRKRRLALDCAVLCVASDHGLFTGLPIVAAVFHHHPWAAALAWFGVHFATSAAKNGWRLVTVLRLRDVGARRRPAGEVAKT